MVCSRDGRIVQIIEAFHSWLHLFSSFPAFLVDVLEDFTCFGSFFLVTILANHDALDQSAGAANSASRRSRMRLIVFSFVFVLAFAVAALGSWLLQKSLGHPEPEPEHRAEIVPPLKKIDRSGTAADLLQRGDDALLHYRYRTALDYYEAFLEQVPSRAAFINYRVALCFESMDRNAEAIAYYRTAIRADATRPLTFACHLGLARCFLRQAHPGDVRRIFTPILFDESKYRGIPSPMVVEAHHLVALSMAQEVAQPAAKNPPLDECLPYIAVELEAIFYLDELAKPSVLPTPANEEMPASKIVLQKDAAFGACVLQYLIQKNKNAKEVLDHIVIEAGFRVDWTPAAKRSIEDRTFQVSVSHRLLIEVVESLADSCDLAIDCKGNVVRFSSNTEIPANNNRARQLQMAQRLLRHALQIDTSNPLTPAVRLELGNTEAQSGNNKEALKWYDAVLASHPASDYALLASNNMAHVHFRDRDLIQARAALYNVIHRSPGHELALRAHVRVGRLFLEEEKNQQAAPPLRAARALSPQSAYQPLAILTLATCHLRMGEYTKARTLLAKDRDYLKKEPYKATGMFLDSYAQYLQAKETNSHRRESADLLNALWNQKDTDVLGPIGPFLCAQAYADLGFEGQAEKLLQRAALDSHTPLHACIEYHLGTLLMNKQEHKEARQLFTNIAEKSPSYRKYAGQQLADLDLLEKRWEDCITRCQHLWKDRPAANPTALLQTWGAAYEGLGDLAKAARCYAGKPPE